MRDKSIVKWDSRIYCHKSEVYGLLIFFEAVGLHIQVDISAASAKKQADFYVMALQLMSMP